jgi:predicted unusual protein kinase regulating ubiquinone biosynthesis (AarF/ABC1/UbiB family)
MAMKKKLNKITSNFLGRGFKLAKLTAQVGARAATHTLDQWISGENKDSDKLKKYFQDQARILTRELGQLKGSVMKAGQLLSTYGEHFLPEEANELLKSLQFQSPPLAWPEVEKVLVKELGQERLAELEINPEPWAAASLGQVHRAKILATGEELALKIQYPGVEKAINTDITFLRLLFQVTDLFPTGFQSEEVLEEIKSMLIQELDYQQEAEETKWFAHQLREEKYIHVPRVFDAYSSGKVLATQFMDSLPASDPEIKTWNQEQRNQVAFLFMKVYIRELFEWGKVQTDPHFGNYRLHLDKEGNPHLILLDFGAVRRMPEAFQSSYRRMVSGAFYRHREDVLAGGLSLGFIAEEDDPALVDKFVEICYLITEPLAAPDSTSAGSALFNEQGEYDWKNSDLPQRLVSLGKGIVRQFRLRTPPREVVFIDRKLGGTFTFLSHLQCRINLRPLFTPYLGTPQGVD